MGDGPQLPLISAKQVVKALRALGFESTRKTSGSHDTMRHADGRTCTVHVGHSGDFPRATLKSALDQAEVTVSEFLIALGGKHRREEHARLKRTT